MNISDYLKYANLQMVAEAVGLSDGLSDEGWIPVLQRGNERASIIPLSAATQFSTEGWVVLSHRSNTTTGFSGTLFKNTQTGELVISFRSTEFLDDAARDNQETNALEIRPYGWAFGQIADMEAWYASLRQSGKIPDGAKFSVTGYSLGGHLATAFALLRREDGHFDDISQVYTFNGAGVGKLAAGQTLAAVIQDFNSRWHAGNADLFTDPQTTSLYQEYRAFFPEGGTVSMAQVDAARQTLQDVLDHPLGHTAAWLTETNLLIAAIDRIGQVVSEAARVPSLSSGSNSLSPASVATTRIAGASLDYQIAAIQAGLLTQSFGDINATRKAFGSIGRDTAGLSKVFDVFGDTSPSLVANSQYHLGQSTPVWIENQPDARGTIPLDVFRSSVGQEGWKLLVPGFSNNDFGDTHSLVLLVDSLSVQSALAALDPSLDSPTVKAIFSAASNLISGSILSGNPGINKQGLADGTSLENVVNALGAYFAVDSLSGWTHLKGNPNGNTWWQIASTDSAYTGREELHKNLQLILNDADFKALGGKVKVAPASGELQTKAQSDFGSLVALETLSPFVLTAKTPADESAFDNLWEEAWCDQYAAWLEDLGSRNVGETPSRYTDEWLADRSSMLSALVAVNLSNSQVGKSFASTDYVDSYSGTQVSVRTGTAVSVNKVTFGADDADTLVGTDTYRGDHLYGGDGDDSLQGRGGNDYLQGDDGDDALTGGTGSDSLAGGPGFDTYQYSTGDGNDRITDSDGDGQILIDGKKVETGVKVMDNVWQSADKSLVFTVQGGNLIIGDRTSSGAKTISGTIAIAGWENGQLGISLPDSAPAPTPPANELIGDQPPDPQHQTFQDNLIGTSGADFIRGLTNDDLLLANAGDDSVEGGLGNDVLMGGIGADTLAGGAGEDLIYGSSTGSHGAGGDLPQGAIIVARGSDWYTFNLGTDSDGFPNGFLWGPHIDEQPGDDGNLIDAGEGNDTILAGTGSDIVHGGADRDDITGMGASDVLMGDAGDDRIYGDGPATDSTLVDYTPPEQQAADYIDGGEGNDILLGDGGDDELFGDAGDDLIWGDDRSATYAPIEVHGNDYLDGEDGRDQLIGGGRDDQIFGGAGNDVLWGDNATITAFDAQFDGNDYLDGEDGDDWLAGQGGDDTLFGGAGNDTLVAGAGSDVLAGEGGKDVYLLSALGAATDVEVTGASSVVVLPAGMGLAKLTAAQVDTSHADLTFSNGPHVVVNGATSFKLGPGASITYSQAQMAQLVKSALTPPAPAPAPGAPAPGAEGGQWLGAVVDVPAAPSPGGGTGGGSSGGSGTIEDDHTSYRADGSFSVVQTAAGGQTVTRNYTPQGTLLGSSASRSEGGNTIASQLDPSGRKVAETWTHADGTSGSDLVGPFDYNGMANVLEQSPARTMATASYFWGNNAAGTDQENYGTGRGFYSDWWTPRAFDATQGPSGSLNVSQYATEYENGSLQFDSGRTPVSQFASTWREIRIGYDVPQDAVRYDPATIAWYTLSDQYTGITIDSEQQIDGSKTIAASRLYYDGTIDYQSPDGSFILYHSEITDLGANSYATSRASATLTLQGNDGTHAVLQDDGLGNVVVTDYDANGTKVLDTWFHNDGSHGTDDFFADGSMRGIASNPDGSVVEFERDAQGHTTLLVRSGPNFALDTPANPVAPITPAPAPQQGHLGWGSVGAPASPPPSSPTELNYPDGNGGSIRIEVFQGAQTAYRTDANGNTSRVDTDPGYAVQSNIDGTSTRTWNYDASGVATGVSIEATLFDGSVTTLLCGPSGRVVGTTVQQTAGPDETDTFDYDAQGQLKGTTVTVAHGAGNAITSHFDAAGVLVSYLVRTMPAANQTMVNSYDAQDRCTGTVISTTDANGVIETNNFDAQGIFTGSVVATPQGDGSINTVNRDSQGKVSSFVTLASDAQGDTVITVFGADGHRVRSDVLQADGTQTSTEYSLEGSSVATSYAPDGSTSVTHDDGAGNVTTTAFDAAGVRTGEVWTRADGASGSETFAGNGTSTGTTLYPNGSHDVSSTDVAGTLTTIHYGADGAKTGSTLTRESSHGATITNLDAAGKTSTVQWSDANGTSGTDTAPVAGQALAAQTANQGTAWSYALPQTAFSDPDAGDSLHYSVKLANGAPLPAWLSFDSAAHTLRGTPGASDAGDLTLTVTATDSYGLAASQSLSLRVNGNVGLNVNGTNAADSLAGGAGNDTINGGAGWDTMAGGAGNDLYIVDSSADQVVELAGQGVDEIRSSVAYKLPANVERLVLTGSGWYVNGTGNELDNVIIGNAAANNLKGNAGNDTLDGGAGDDFLYGTVGNDTYVLGRGYGVDTITESDVTGGNKDIAQFAADISFNQLWFARAGNSLDVSVIGTGDRLHIDNWYSGQLTHVEEFRSGDGRVLSDTRVQDLVQAMSGLKAPPPGTTVLPADYVQILAPAFAADWI